MFRVGKHVCVVSMDWCISSGNDVLRRHRRCMISLFWLVHRCCQFRQPTHPPTAVTTVPSLSKSRAIVSWHPTKRCGCQPTGTARHCICTGEVKMMLHAACRMLMLICCMSHADADLLMLHAARCWCCMLTRNDETMRCRLLQYVVRGSTSVDYFNLRKSKKPLSISQARW